MQKLLLPLLIILGLLIVAVPAYSQFSAGTIQTNVPFDFVAGDTRLPAGDYKFEFDTQHSRMNIINIATNQRVSLIVRDIVDKSAPTDNRLVFLQKGNDHVLHRVWSDRVGHAHDIVHGTQYEDLK
jgi:hypothetical protein